jgi:hypothetical protein
MLPSSPGFNGFTDAGIVALSPTDAWAAGGDGRDFPAFVEHWDGTKWTLSWKANPFNPGSPQTLDLLGLAAAGPSAAWAVGMNQSTSHPVIVSYNGSSWRYDHTPTRPDPAFLNGVAAVSANDVWAVGDKGKGLRSYTLIEHWDGSSWKVVPSPNGGPSTLVRTPKGPRVPSGREPLSVSALSAIAVVSPDDIWAVGGYDRALPSRKEKGMYRPAYRVRLLTEHWNGTRWTLGPTPVLESRAISPAGIPTYGFYETLAAAPSGDLIGAGSPRLWRFNGSTWKPDPTWKPIHDLMATTISGPDDAWAMGSLNGNAELAAVHWDGNQWTQTKLAAEGSIYAAAESGPSDVWAAGDIHRLTGNTNQEVMLHYTC